MFALAGVVAVADASADASAGACPLPTPATETVAVSNQCVTFTVGSGTGCAWMCGYCAAALGPNYYFTDSVCTYSTGSCVGNPVAGKTYTCCSSGGRVTKILL